MKKIILALMFASLAACGADKQETTIGITCINRQSLTIVGGVYYPDADKPYTMVNTERFEGMANDHWSCAYPVTSGGDSNDGKHVPSEIS